MHSRKILILDGHPFAQSFTAAVAQAYANGARAAGHDVQHIALRDLTFDLSLHAGYHTPQTLEPDLVEQQRLITWCEHLVIATPVWWMMLPALTKGWCDRVLLPGFAFKFHGHTRVWDRLLRGRSARVLITQDAPLPWLHHLLGNAFWKCLKEGILDFCGFAPVHRTVFADLAKSTERQRAHFLQRARHLGTSGQ